MQIIEWIPNVLREILSPKFYLDQNKNNDDIINIKRKMNQLIESIIFKYFESNLSDEKFKETKVFTNYIGEFRALYTSLLFACIHNNNDFFKLQVRKNIDHCAICFLPHDSCAQTACNHFIGHQCFLSWFLENDTCPICNTNLLTKNKV